MSCKAIGRQYVKVTDSSPAGAVSTAALCNCNPGKTVSEKWSVGESDADLALMTDASDFGIDASLNKITSDGFKLLGFFSKKLTPAQTKYSAFDRELLAAYSATTYFRHMIEGHVLIFYTDHKPLTFAFNQKLDEASSRQLRHLDFISQFITDIRYVPGIDNVPTDAFSRI
ncbi:retrovirus-related Pol polyprotein from transposon 17.6 [Trichonephila clavipes]|nr:retrovirus-related Pol polyprotein from transposon 17.6 [Trichonephila clavipes]